MGRNAQACGGMHLLVRGTAGSPRLDFTASPRMLPCSYREYLPAISWEDIDRPGIILPRLEKEYFLTVTRLLPWTLRPAQRASGARHPTKTDFGRLGASG